MSPRRLVALVPVAVFIILVCFFGYRLTMIDRGDAPNRIPSALINKPMPDFELPKLAENKTLLKSADLKGKVILVNFFASWCEECRIEHPLLKQLTDADVFLVGLNYKDKEDKAAAWLQKLGNPYAVVGGDSTGRVGIDFGVYGVPETYVIDKQGMIRYKQTGPLTPADIQNILLPLVRRLNQ